MWGKSPRATGQLRGMRRTALDERVPHQQLEEAASGWKSGNAAAGTNG